MESPRDCKVLQCLKETTIIHLCHLEMRDTEAEHIPAQVWDTCSCELSYPSQRYESQYSVSIGPVHRRTYRPSPDSQWVCWINRVSNNAYIPYLTILSVSDIYILASTLSFMLNNGLCCL